MPCVQSASALRDKRGMGKELGLDFAEIRAFGGVLTKDHGSSPTMQSWSGRARDGSTINLVHTAGVGWVATALVSSVSIIPHLHSSSPQAAFRNLRGHLHNLQISLTDMLRLRGRNG